MRIAVENTDDHFRAVFLASVERETNWTVLDYLPQAEPAERTTREVGADIVLLDTTQIKDSAVARIQELKRQRIPAVVALVESANSLLIPALLSAGVDACIPKYSPMHSVILAIKSLVQMNSETIGVLRNLASSEFAENAQQSTLKNRGASLSLSHNTKLLLVSFAVALGVWALIAFWYYAPHTFQDRRILPRAKILFDSKGSTYREVRRISSNSIVKEDNVLLLPVSDVLTFEQRAQKAVEKYLEGSPEILAGVPRSSLMVKDIRGWNTSAEAKPPFTWGMWYAHIVQHINGLEVEDGRAILTLQVTPEQPNAVTIVRVSKTFFPDVLSLPEADTHEGYGVKHLKKRLGESIAPEYLRKSIRYYANQWRVVEEYFIPEISAFGAVSPDGETYLVDARSHFGPEDLKVHGIGNTRGPFSHKTRAEIPLENYPYNLSCSRFDPGLRRDVSTGVWNGFSQRGGQLFSDEAMSWFAQRWQISDFCSLESDNTRGSFDFRGDLPRVDVDFLKFLSWTEIQNELRSWSTVGNNPTDDNVAAVNIFHSLHRANQSPVLKKLKKTHKDIGLEQTPVHLFDLSECNALAVGDQLLAFTNNSSCRLALDSVAYHEYFHLLHFRFKEWWLFPSSEAVADIFSAYMRGESCIGPLDDWTCERELKCETRNCLRDINGQFLALNDVDHEIISNKKTDYNVAGHFLSLPLSSAYWEIQSIAEIGKELAAEWFLGVAFNSGAQLMGEYFLNILDAAKQSFEQGRISCEEYKQTYRSFAKRGFINSDWGPETFDQNYFFNRCALDYFDEYEFNEPPLSNGDPRIKYLDDAFSNSKLSYFIAECSGPEAFCEWNVAMINWGEARPTGQIPTPQIRFNGAKARFFHKSPLGGSGVKQHGWVSRVTD